MPTSSDGFRFRVYPKILTVQPANLYKNFYDFYKAAGDLAWINPKFRQLTGYGAYPITISEFDDVMRGIQSGIQQNTKFTDDLDQILRLRTSSPQHSSIENLIKFKKIPSYLGWGAESAVFKGSDLSHVYKTPHTSFNFRTWRFKFYLNRCFRIQYRRYVSKSNKVCKWF